MRCDCLIYVNHPKEIEIHLLLCRLYVAEFCDSRYPKARQVDDVVYLVNEQMWSIHLIAS